MITQSSTMKTVNKDLLKIKSETPLPQQQKNKKKIKRMYLLLWAYTTGECGGERNSLSSLKSRRRSIQTKKYISLKRKF